MIVEAPRAGTYLMEVDYLTEDPRAYEYSINGGPAATLNLDTLAEKLNVALNARFSPGKSVVYLMPTQELPYLVLDPRAFGKVTEAEALSVLIEKRTPTTVRFHRQSSNSPGTDAATVGPSGGAIWRASSSPE